MKPAWAALTLLIASHASPARAEDYVLFEARGKPVAWETYNDIVEKLGPGDTIQFSDGKRFEVREILGGRAQNLVIDIGDGRVLRIPSRVLPMRAMSGGTLSIALFFKGYLELKAAGVRVARVFEEESLPPEYVVEEKVPVEFLLSQFEKGEIPLDPERRKLVEDKLVEFAKATWLYETIGDFDGTQLAWTGSEWVLIDWNDQHFYAKAAGSLNTFRRADLPRPLEARVGRAIAAARAARFALNFCAKLLGGGFRPPIRYTDEASAAALGLDIGVVSRD